jgi:hypothetical protein
MSEAACLQYVIIAASVTKKSTYGTALIHARSIMSEAPERAAGSRRNRCCVSYANRTLGHLEGDSYTQRANGSAPPAVG